MAVCILRREAKVVDAGRVAINDGDAQSYYSLCIHDAASTIVDDCHVDGVYNAADNEFFIIDGDAAVVDDCYVDGIHDDGFDDNERVVDILAGIVNDCHGGKYDECRVVDNYSAAGKKLPLGSNNPSTSHNEGPIVDRWSRIVTPAWTGLCSAGSSKWSRPPFIAR